MIIQTLQVEQFRHLASQTLSFDSHFNLIVGKNASGKSSLLEAIYFLSQLRSFRTSRINQVIREDTDYFRVMAGLISPQGIDSYLGIERTKGGVLVRQDGETIQKRSHLAKLLPMLFLGPDTGTDLMEEPKSRRQFIDWGLFQNYEAYHRVWQRYDRALSQRNAGLKGGYPNAVLESIELEMSEAGEALNQYRRQFIEEIAPLATALLSRLVSSEIEWQFQYQSGFTEGMLQQELAELRDRDRQMTFTRIGPHRGDFTLKCDGRMAHYHLSRGQVKLATIALMLAQVKMHQEISQSSTILLMDDLTAELDQKRRLILLEELLAHKSQLFVTCLEASEFPELSDLTVQKGMMTYQLNDGLAQKMV
ncbi:DNA replication and repair protein RecF [Ignatzschineria larvae DSM 13226]|uniref:DNA replication and repair protein RecF n=1 Tax=Ignatzschineria larvae DSM 13226 TaxID=1111732 RepID=A0ABZ3BZE5_9GAMM|nr:DNA replication and repair protein RecF [Ignatzschineria larvae]